jgi:CRISPR-associated protein Cst2
MHLFGTVLTPQAVASNNRGESEGTVATLQKVIRNGDLYSTVSSEAVRYALRESWQSDPKLPRLARKVFHTGSEWAAGAKEFDTPEQYVDNDVLGYMHAKKETASRRGALEVGRAVSVTPWPGTIDHHFASPGSNPSIEKNDPIPYACEIHDTRYQYTFAMTPASLLKDKYARTEMTLRALQNLRRVGGSHARFLFDFAPEAVVLRWTTDPAPRIMFCFAQDDRGRLSLATLMRRVKGGDVVGSEVFVGTAIAGIAEMDALRAEGVNVFDGVKRAVDAVLERVQTDPDLKG